MNILPIDNINTHKVQFKAKFPKKDLKTFIEAARFTEWEGIIQLYTMLDMIKKAPGEKAKLVRNNADWYQIHIDSKSLTGERKFINPMQALFDALVNYKNTLLKETPLKRISEEEFENKFYKNCKKTEKDIINIYKE